MNSYLSNSKPEVTMQERKRFDFPPTVLYENRFCNQDDFSILVCGGIDQNNNLVKSIFKLQGPNFECEKYTNMAEAIYDCKTAIIFSNLFVLGGINQYADTTTYVRKFCSKTKTWSCKAKTDINFNNFIVCSFMQNIYVIRYDGSCFLYNFEANKLIRIAFMKELRYYASCTVFEGKVVVTGGSDKKSVEAYDYYENKWTYLPDMIEKRSYHASVSMGNKLFVVGGDSISSCEVFDNCSRKFTIIKSEM